MFIRDIMTKGVITVAPEQSIADALAIMLEKRISFIVVEADHKPVGVLTEGDMVALAKENDDAAIQRVAQFMNSPVITVQDDANVFHAYDEILQHRIRYIVVVDHAGDLIGVITMSNFLASMGVEHLARLRHVSEEATTTLETVTPDTPMVDVVATMHRCRHALIAIENNRPVGLISSRDITRMYSQDRCCFTQKTMRDCMRTNIVTLFKSAYIPEANNLMRSQHTRHIVVLDDDHSLFGLLTISDVVRSMESKYMAFMKAVMNEMERDLQIRSVQQAALFDRNPNAVFSLDKNLDVIASNPASVLLTGLTEAALMNSAMINLLMAKDHAQFTQACHDAMNGDACSMYATMIGEHSENVFAFLNMVPVIVDNNLPGLYVVAHDVTERTIAERHLRLLSSALEQANESILIINEEGHVEFANRSFSRCFGGGDDDLTGKHCDDLLTCSVCGSAKQLWQVLKNEGAKQYNDAEIRLHNGTVLDAKLSVSVFNLDQDKASHLIMVLENMQERRAIEAQLRQAQKMEALGTLVGGIAHDFNNLLASISGNLFLIREEIACQPDTAKKVAVLEKECFRAADLIQQLLVFARKGNVRKERVNFCKVVQDSLDLGRVALPANIELISDIPLFPLDVMGNSQQLQQVILNLLNNAKDAVAKQENPRIELRLIHKKNSDDCGGQAVLTLRDNGKGIHHDDITHIFEPFFTTKDVGQGSGLGLSMAYGSIEQHEGKLSVESQYGHGASFTVALPCLPTDTVLSDDALSLGDHVRQHYILVADDEPRVREMCASLLESRHYRVLLADSGEAALERVEEYGDAIDLVILDVMMPGLTGVDVWSRLVTTMPDMPVLLMTGYDRHNITQGLPSQVADAHVLKKPFYPADFLLRVEEMIGD